MRNTTINPHRISKRILEIEDVLVKAKLALDYGDTATATVYLAMIQRESSGMLLDMWLLEECGEHIANPILSAIKQCA